MAPKGTRNRGAFPKGVSGNPGGRAKGLRALMRAKYGDDAATLVDGIHAIAFTRRADVAVKTKLEALKLLLAYHSGAPPQAVSLEGPDGNPIGPLTFVLKGREAATA